MLQTTTIGVDTGNSSTKTHNFIFPSGLACSIEPFPMSDNLFYNGKYYTHIAERTTYKKDKSEDDTYYILTLIAIAKELQERYPTNATDFFIDLAIGIPPQHYRSKGLKEKFASYFKQNEDINFEWNKREFCVLFNSVGVYPQAYSAIVSSIEDVASCSEAYLLDMGGFTFDVLRLSNGVPDMSVCESFDFGTIPFYSSVRANIDNEFNYTLSDIEIDSVLKGENDLLPCDIKNSIEEQSKSYMKKFFQLLSEKKISLQYKKTVLIGGGNLLFKKQIVAGKFLVHYTFIEDVKANAVGYELLHEKVSGLNG